MSVYRLDQSEVPVPGGELTPETAINALAPATGERDALIYGAGRRLHVFDVSRPESPVEVTSLPLRVDASRALRQGDMLYVFGKAGLEMFDLSQRGHPKTVGFVQTKRDVRNAWVTRSSAILVYDDPIVEIVDLSSRGGPRVVGTIATEDWVREYVPVAGCIRRHHQHAVVLSRDQRSVRFLRLRRNIVDREKLDAWRARVRREGHASGQSVRRGNRHR